MDIIGLIETNVHWKRYHVTSNLNSILKDTWTAEKIGTCISESNLSLNSDYKPGGTAMILLNKLTSATISNGQDLSGLGRWTFITLLKKTMKEQPYSSCIGHAIVPSNQSEEQQSSNNNGYCYNNKNDTSIYTKQQSQI